WKWDRQRTRANANSSTPRRPSLRVSHHLLQLIRRLLPCLSRRALKNELDGGKVAFGGRSGAGGVQDSRDRAYGCASDARNEIQSQSGKFPALEWPEGFSLAHQ